MSFKFQEIILEDVHALIKNLTGFQESQDNFKACERFILSNLLHHRFVSVDRISVRKSLEGIVTKLYIHCHIKESEKLDSLVNQFLSSTGFKDCSTVDIKWCLLSLLLHLAHSPTNLVKNKSHFSTPPVSPASNEGNEFDWVSYLREGEDEFQQDWRDTSSEEDEVDCAVVSKNESPSLCSSLGETKDVIKSVLVLPPNKEVSELSVMNENTEPNWIRKMNAKRIHQAESWLIANIQHDWWTKAHISHLPCSKHPFSQTAQLCFDAKEGIKISTLSEHKVVLEITWLLSAPCDSVVFMKSISDDGLDTHFCVRPHVTVPSLMPDVFSSFGSFFCAYADIIEELQTFCLELSGVNNQKLVCGTYQAYRSALQHELKPLQQFLAKLQLRVLDQGETFTLLTLAHTLEPWLLNVFSIYKLHKAAVLDWRHNPNWSCATHLLSVILNSLQNSESNNGTKFRIFVKTFQVYIMIIEHWLTSGQLIDPHDEFFITRGEKKNSALGTSFEKRGWETVLNTRGVEIPRALQVLANSILKASQPLHVLCELRRLSELRKHTALTCSLECLFLQILIRDLEAVQCNKADSMEEGKDHLKQWWRKLDYYLPSEVELSLKPKENQNQSFNKINVDEKAIMGHLHRLDCDLLVKDFEAILQDSRGIDNSEIQCKNEKKLLFEKLLMLSHNISSTISLESCVERAVLCLSKDWECIAGALVANILVCERQLFFHLNSAQSLFLLQASYKLKPFLSHIFKLLLHRDDLSWANSHSLSVLLQDCMDSDQFSVTVLTDNKDVLNMNALDCIDSFCIQYQMDWPLCAIIEENSQINYNHILRLLLKIKWGLWILEQLDITDFKNCDATGVSGRMLHLRYWLLHVLSGSYSFLAGHVLNSLWMKFDEAIKSAKDMHSIMQVHARFLDNALHQSLGAKIQDPIKNALFQLVVLAENLHVLWYCGLSEVSLSRLNNMEVCYIQCHCFLAASLHSLAEVEGLNHLGILSDLFNSNLPQEAVS